MKKIYLLLTSLFMMGSAASYGQDYLDIPTAATGEDKTNLYWWIAQDTTDTGERESDNRVYRLERGGEYIMHGHEPFNFSFGIVAGEDESTGDGSGRPPVILRGVYGTGDDIQSLMTFKGDNNRYYFENLIFNGLSFGSDSYETDWNKGLYFLGNNTRVEVKSCVFNAWNAGGIIFEGKDNIVYLSDNSFRNGVMINQPFAGQQGSFSVHPMDTIVVTNNSYINNQSYWIIQGHGSGGLADYVLFEHNTVMGSVVNTLFIREMINAHLRSNIFYAEAVYGDSPASAGWYTEDGSRLAVMYFTDVKGSKLADAGLTEADRIINVSHNTFFQPQYVTDFHAAYPDITGGVFMNDVTKAMFNDNTTYPHLDMSNNVEVDPEFANEEVDEYVSEEVTLSAKSYFDTRGDEGWGIAPNRRNIDEHLGSGEIRLMDWPLVEGGLEITSSSLLTGGHDGLPVGNLNWDASKRGQYNLPNGVGGMLGLSMFGGSLSNDNHDFASKGYELSSYPNPAVETATIAFKLPKKSNVIISVYNTMGQQIAVLANGSFAKGNHNVIWDASNVASGLYIYKLETEEATQAHQIIITK